VERCQKLAPRFQFLELNFYFKVPEKVLDFLLIFQISANFWHKNQEPSISLDKNVEIRKEFHKISIKISTFSRKKLDIHIKQSKFV